jgi:hypothetical protein
MALKTVVQTLEDVEAGHQDLYKEFKIKGANGGDTVIFALDVEGVEEHPVVQALKNAFERTKVERKKLSEDLATLKSRLAALPEDFDPEKYQEILTELEELKADPNHQNRKPDEKERQELAQARKNLEQKLARAEKEYKDSIDKKDAEIKKRQEKIAKLLIDDGLTKALIEAGVGKEFLKASKAMLRDQCTVIEDDGDYRAVVQSDMGEMEIPRYVTDWVASDEGKVFVPPAKGSGAGNTDRPTTRLPGSDGRNPWAKETWNLTEQGKILKEDRTRAEKLAKAAGKKLPAPVA